jgi:hypothetical protein
MESKRINPMPTSLFDPEVSNILDPATWVASGASLTPSPADWRDHWIYFLLVDRGCSY